MAVGGGMSYLPPGSSGGGGGSSFFSNPYNMMTGVGSILDIVGSIVQGGAYDRTLNALTGDLNQVIGPETAYGSHLLQNFTSQVSPELQSLYGTASNLATQSYGTAGAYGGAAAGSAAALGANPYLAPAQSQIGGLLNYKAFTPQEEAALTTGAGEAASSAASTMAAQSGGVANPALLMKQLATGAGTTSAQTAVQLGSIASQQHLQAMESALSGEEALGQEYISGNTAAGQIYSGLSSEYAGLSESELNSALSSLDIQSQELGTGANLLGTAGTQIGDVLSQVYSGAQSSGGGMSGLMSGLGGLASLIPMFA